MADVLPNPAAQSSRRSAPWALIALFAVAGALHFVWPGAYVRMMPPWLPAPRLLVLVSGAAELAGAVGLIVPALRPAAGWALIALLAAVLPANVHMLLAAQAADAPASVQALLWARLPLQPLLMWWVWTSAVRRR